MATITLENVPASLSEKVWDRADFSQVVGLYFDGMDWCQYDEVVPSKEDIIAYKESEVSSEGKEAFSFLDSLK